MGLSIMSEPLVSIIIPTYNRLNYVQRAVESALQQSYQNTEVWVIDDGSTDGTAEVLRGRYGERINYVWQENQDRSVARNLGLSLANGKYIAFLDSDDVWLPEKLSSQVQVMECPKSENLVAVCSSAWRIDFEGKRLGSVPVGRAGKLAQFKLADFFNGPKIFASPSNMLIRAEALRLTGGFDPTIRYGEDWDLIIRLRANGQFHYIDQPLLEYRVHSSGTQEISVVENIPRYLEDRLTVIQKNAYLLKNAQPALELAQTQLYEDTAYRYFAADSISQGFEYLCRAGAVQKSLLTPLRISQKIGTWVTAGALERLKSPEAVEEYFNSKFLPSFLEQWPLYLDSRPNINQLLGWLYYHLALVYLNQNKEVAGYFSRKSVSHFPLFALKPEIISLIVREYFLSHS